MSTNANDNLGLKEINTNDVESVEYLRSMANSAMYGAYGGGGVLVITTKRGTPEYEDKHRAPDVINYGPLGYYKARQFYSPMYDDPATNANMADLRSTILWNPNLITENGNTSFDFFTADSKGTYKVVVEGIDNDGHLGRQVYEFKVN
jgi:outer membrane receptor protein involved in Fe transport